MTSLPLSKTIVQDYGRLRRRVQALACKGFAQLPLMKEWGATTFPSRACKCGAMAMTFENHSGRIDTIVDAGILVTGFEFLPDILDMRYRSNNSTAPPVLPQYPPPSGDGPSEVDFGIYASMSMEDYEAPPPPRAPLGGVPFEDYYDEPVGVDYISKEDIPTSSLLQFLDSLSAKKAEEGANYGVSPRKRQSRHTPSSIYRDPSFNDGTPLISELQDMEEQGISQINNIDEPMMQQEHLSSSKMKQTLENGGLVFARTTTSQASRNSSDGVGASSSSPVEQSNAPFSNYHQARSLEDFQAYSLTRPIQETTDRTTISAQMRDSRDAGTLSWMPPQSSLDDRPNQDFKQEKLRGRDGDGSKETITPPKPSEDAWPEEASEADFECRDRVASLLSGTPSFDTAVQGLDTETRSRSQFYEPRVGDLILGAVKFVNDQKVELEIGAEMTALMPLRELRPFPQNVNNVYFELPLASTDSSCVPLGKSLLLGERISGDGGVICTIVVAEVTGRTVSEGRAVLSCRALAQKLAWHRIEQLMWLGEAIQFEVLQWNEGGLLGFLEGVRAFLPKSELTQRPVSMSILKSYVGRVLHVTIIQADRQASNVILSEAMAWKCKHLQLGTVHDVSVMKVHSYGMQVEIENTSIRGFVHISNFTNDYISSVSNYFVEGDKARVMVIKGRKPSQISFGFANLEKENGLLLRDKEQVFHDADEMAHRFRDALSEQERQSFSKTFIVNTSCPVYHEPTIANSAWVS